MQRVYTCGRVACAMRHVGERGLESACVAWKWVLVALPGMEVGTAALGGVEVGPPGSWLPLWSNISRSPGWVGGTYLFEEIDHRAPTL